MKAVSRLTRCRYPQRDVIFGVAVPVVDLQSPEEFDSMRTRILSAVIIAVWSLFALTLAAQELESRVVEHTLPNGMKLLLLKRTQSPTVALSMYLKVGAVDEPINRTGIAHMMIEHMLLKGTRILGTKNYEAEAPLIARLDALYEQYDNERDKGEAADPARLAELERQIQETQEEQKQYILSNELDQVYSYHGAEDLNAGTSIDYTTYYMSLPKNKLELWMMIESERMRDPVLREFYTERDVVMEERRMRYETQPDGMLQEQFQAAAFIAHPYGRPVIGWASDLSRLKRAEAEKFFRTYYAPNNTVVAIVGDIEPHAVISMMTEYFGNIPPQELPERVSTKEPEQRGERRVTVEFDAEPQLLIGFHKPTLPAYDDFVFDVISGLLSKGRTSRLYKSLVEEKQLAVSVDTYNGWPGARYDNLFLIEAVPRFPHTTQEVEDAIYAELQRLADEPVPERELQKVRNQLEAEFIRGLGSNEGMASNLAYFELIAGSWRYLLTFRETVKKIGAEDIQRAAKKYLNASNRTVATLVKKASAQKGSENAQ